MAYLALVLPRLRHLQSPFSRDQAFLLLAAFNQFFIAIDIYLAHNISGGIKPAEWIPIVSGFVCGAILLIAGAIAVKNRNLASALANLVFALSIGIGLLGAYFHLNRTVLLSEGLVSIQAVATLIWAPPVIGPLFYVLVGVLGISAAWIEKPVDSGRLQLFAGKTVQMPYSKTRAYLLIVSIFILATLISSVLDHARFGFDNAWVWLPVTAALFGFSTSLYLGIMSLPSAGDIMAHGTAMLLLIAVGVVGFVLHSESSLTSAGVIVIERFLRGSPLLAPLLFCNVGLMGLLALLAPGEGARISTG